MLSRTKTPGDWFGVNFGFNIYRGCSHRCIYCDSRSECYGIEDFETVQVKTNAIDLLRRELRSKPPGTVIGTGAMSDPYVHAETRYGLTARALELLAARELGIHIVTKSDLIVRDLEVLRRLARVHATVAFTVTAADEGLARVVEPGAPGPERRFAAMAQLAAGAGVTVGVTLMPVLPFVQDSVENVVSIVDRCAAAGGRFVIAWFGMTLRDRQREHYYGELDKHFPGVRARYEAAFGSRYSAACPDAGVLHREFVGACARHGLIYSMSELVAAVRPRAPRQERLF